MVKNKRTIGLVFGLSLIMAALRTALITYTMEKNSFESDVYYLPDNNLWVNIFTAATLVLSAAIIYFAFSVGRGKTIGFDTKGFAGLPGIVVSFLLIGAALVYIFASPEEKLQAGTLQKLIVILSLCSAVSLLAIGLKNNNENLKKSTVGSLMLLPIALFALRLLEQFVRTSASPLASGGGYSILGLAAILLYLLCEGKSYVLGGSAILCYLFGYFAIFLSVVYSVPDLILNCFGVFDFDFHAAYSAVNLGMAIYIAIKLNCADISDNKGVKE